MSERRKTTLPSFEESLVAIEDSFRLRLAALKTNSFLPNLEKPVILQEWDDLNALYQRLETTPGSDAAFKILPKLSDQQNYYSFHHRAFRSYFVLDTRTNCLVGLVVLRSYSDDGKELLAILEHARKRYMSEA